MVLFQRMIMTELIVVLMEFVVLLYLPFSNQQTIPNITIADLSLLSESSEYITVSERFTDWKHWKLVYPQCDPSKNKFLSPINIKSKTAVIGKLMKPIVVFAGSPSHACFFLSMVHKNDELEMEVVNIIPLPECETTITHITGAGEKVKDKRYFRRALIMFSRSEVRMPQSLHRIDGKSFQMEIALEFVDYNQNELASTEIHVLVEAKPPEEVPENPIFKPLQDTLPSLKEEIKKEASGNTDRASKYKKLEAKCITAKRNYSSMLSLHKNFSDYNKRIERLEEIIKDIGGITNSDFRRLSDQRFDVMSHGPLNNTIEQIQDDIKKLEKKKQDLKHMLYEETDEQVLKMLFETKSKILILTRALVNAKEKKLPNIKKSPEKKYKSVVNSLKKNKVGIPGEPPYRGQEFDSPDSLRDELSRIQAKRVKVLESKKEMDAICREFADFQRHEPYGFVPINLPFQISWLFPQTGGFYMYNGSSPIPKCERRKHSIVFENPIRITTDQLAAFQSLPSLLKLRREARKGKVFTNNVLASVPEAWMEFNASTDDTEIDLLVDKMIPVIAVNDSRKVVYVPKSPVYLSDDALHRVGKRKNYSAETDEESGRGIKVNGVPRGRTLLTDESADADTASGLQQAYSSYVLIFSCAFCISNMEF